MHFIRLDESYTMVKSNLTKSHQNQSDKFVPLVRRWSANVCMNDEGVVVWVVLKPEIGFGKCNRDMGPRGTEVFAFAHM